MSTASDLGRKLGEHLAQRVLDQLYNELDTAIHELGANYDHTDAELEQFRDDFIEAALNAMTEKL